jgi:hypothetical protein
MLSLLYAGISGSNHIRPYRDGRNDKKPQLSRILFEFFRLSLENRHKPKQHKHPTFICVVWNTREIWLCLCMLASTYYTIGKRILFKFTLKKVYDGPTVNSPLLLEKSGLSTTPFTVNSSSNEMLVRFTTDEAITLSGFLAVYSTA